MDKGYILSSLPKIDRYFLASARKSSPVQKYKKRKPKKDEAALNSLNQFTRNKAAEDYETATQKYEAFYEKHADAKDAYEAAQSYFAAVMNGRQDFPIKDWQKEQMELAAKRYALCDEYYSLKEEVQNTEAIRRCIEGLMRGEVQSEQPQRVQAMFL